MNLDLGFAAFGSAFAIIAAMAVAGSASQLGDARQTALQENVEAYDGVNVVAYKNGEKVTKTHNALMEGNLSIENMITGSDTHVWDTITVGNGTIPEAGDGSLDSEWSSCGLSPKSTSFDSTTENGNWNLSVTYDVSCDNVIVNTTAQYSSGAGSNEDYFAGADLGRDINLYSGDSLTIEWNNQVS